MDAGYPEIPVEMIRLFHTIDRELYSILVFELERDPKVSMKTIALWIWLEQADFNNVVPTILSSPIDLINRLADEAVVCLRCITDTLYLFSSAASEISLTQHLLGKPLSLKYFHENRARASCGIRMVVDNVCVKALKDLMEIAIKRNTEQRLLKSQMAVMPPPVAQAMNPRIPTFGQFRLTGESSQSVVPPLDMKVPKDNRTMFVTFSKGYPVSETELRAFFNRMFDNCVESISMQVVKPNEQSLFALIVFSTPAIIDFILKGMEKAKFTIKGKQVWMRKFIPKAKGPLQVV